MSETDGVGAGINDVEILNTRNCLFGIEDGARTTTRQAPPQVSGDGDDGEGGGVRSLSAVIHEDGGTVSTSSDQHFTSHQNPLEV
jgi:hypothetical protein